MRKVVFLVLTLVLGAIITQCGGGSGSAAATIATPSLADIHTALGLNNTYGMVPNLTFGAITLPVCTKADGSALDFAVTYALTGTPAWLTFDATTRAVSLANGATTFPADALTASEVTYTCTDDADPTVTASQAFTINDLDGGSVTDGYEYQYGEIPFLGKGIWMQLNPRNLVEYRVQPSGGTTFGNPTTVTKITVGMDPLDPADDIADFDDDATAPSGGGTNAVEIAAGTDPMVYPTEAALSTVTPYPTTGAPSKVITADFNGDEILDIAYQMTMINNITIVIGVGDGTFTTTGGFTMTQTGPGALAVADMDNDGDNDLLFTSTPSAGVFVCINGGSATFVCSSVYSTGASSSPSDLITVDLDKDGYADVVTANYGAGGTGTAVSVLLNKGDGTLDTAVSYTSGTGPQTVTAADFNNDGNMDVAVGNKAGNNVSVLFGDGSGVLNGLITKTAGTAPNAIIASDFNNDNYVDIAVDNSTSNNVSVFLNNGDSTFADAANYDVDTTPRGFAVADLDGNGTADLVSNASGVSGISLLLGTGDGTFEAGPTISTKNGPVGLTAGDFDADGAIDLAITASSGSDYFLQIHMNE